MNKYYPLLFCLANLVCLFQITGFAQNCQQSEVPLTVNLTTDNFPAETSWELKDGLNNTVLAQSPSYNGMPQTTISDTICVIASACLEFIIYDGFGDGICCGFGNGVYEVWLDGALVATGGDFDREERSTFNCPPGFDCGSSISVSEGSYTTPMSNYWYNFQPSQSGFYDISSCGAACNTAIWVYDACLGINVTNDVEGSFAFNDSNNICGDEAWLSIALDSAVTYYIRIGDRNADCQPDSIAWSVQYAGPIVGCLDPSACNYDPLATVADACIYPGDPQCPDGPDLIVGEAQVLQSLGVSTTPGDMCDVDEGCLTGLGQRDILSFSTWIGNIGNQDYYIGNPADNPDQFDQNNCHGHTHYKGYAEYLLYDRNGVEIPVGFKNGFCVIDLDCSMGGVGQYTCGNMGITAQCADIYGAGTRCNWIDITTVDTGTYILVVRTNWDRDPDALGRHETNYNNNWAQVCLSITRDVNGTPDFSIQTNCAPFVDCAGDIYGSAQPDCEGTCAGTALTGDLINDATLDAADVAAYLDVALNSNLVPSACNDLNADGELTVYDLSLLGNCLANSNGDCDFPAGLTNIFDTVTLSIDSANFDLGFVDISAHSPTANLLAYQFNVSGMTLSTANHINESGLLVQPEVSITNSMVVGLAIDDSVVIRSPDAQPLVRVFFDEIEDSVVCIDQIFDIVNQDYQNVITEIGIACAVKRTEPTDTVSTSINELDLQIEAYLVPNPFDRVTTLKLADYRGQLYNLKITEMSGKLVHEQNGLTQGSYRIDGTHLQAGIYLLRLSGEVNRVMRLVVK